MKTSINLTNMKDSDSSKHYKTFLKIKRKSVCSDSDQTNKHIDNAYKVKHNNSKKRSNSKKK